ncbi:Ser/Thr protein phosphatase [Tritrichomonas foetus]|uniref:Serine/threonine-protein phosphatase n=1 Tax=Tritrichomonas foetus TaxID=1144522 RepID=A0A1J4KFC0_9EUKA|nr:Ser/Thr protein phosphatase [Tritrichomonas foetus]|eukprot:OHT09875.1 Ser/Thr protein phosphatase [Tritrichomonas foetus]
MHEEGVIRGIADRILNDYSSVLSLAPDKIGELGVTVPIPTFSEQSIKEISDRAKDVFIAQETLIDVPAPIYVIGDLHGNVFDLVRILIMAGPPPINRFLFLGDYVDRGQYSVEIVTLLFALVSKYPDHVYLLRGNHEFARVNSTYGFQDECETLYKTKVLYDYINDCFNYMPLAAVIGNEIFCVHGGISPQVSSFRQLKRVKKPIVEYDNNVACDLTWSDPSMDTKEYLRSSRGNGVTFGVTAVRTFLKSFNIKHILRAHQCVQLGIERFAGDSVYTIFSCSNYTDANGNRCGLVYIQENMSIQSFSLPPIDQIPREKALMTGELYYNEFEIPADSETGPSLGSIANDSKRSSLLCLMTPKTTLFTRKRNVAIMQRKAAHQSMKINNVLPPLSDPPEMNANTKPRVGTPEPRLHNPLLAR